MFRVHSVSQRPNLRHLGEPLGGAKSLLEAVSFKKAMEGMGRGRVANARWERVPGDLARIFLALLQFQYISV